MKIIYTKSYERGLKKLKKYNNEYQNLEKIIKIVRNTPNFNELLKLPSAMMYRFERLKYNLNNFYSFNLSKTGGTIRLIVKPKADNLIELYLIFISFDHYDDFNIERVIYHDE